MYFCAGTQSFQHYSLHHWKGRIFPAQSLVHLHSTSITTQGKGTEHGVCSPVGRKGMSQLSWGRRGVLQTAERSWFAPADSGGAQRMWGYGCDMRTQYRDNCRWRESIGWGWGAGDSTQMPLLSASPLPGHPVHTGLCPQPGVLCHLTTQSKVAGHGLRQDFIELSE